jgi:hypothetical protein
MIDDLFRLERSGNPLVSVDRWAPVTPSDTVDLAEKPRALWIGTGGNLVLRGADGEIATFPVGDNVMLPMAPHRVLATGTTAAGIVALY